MSATRLLRLAGGVIGATSAVASCYNEKEWEPNQCACETIGSDVMSSKNSCIASRCCYSSFEASCRF
jgi:hypothetical protein